MKAHRDAGTGEFVTDEYAAANPDTTITETIELPDVPDDLSELGEAQPQAPYRTLLEVWRAVLEPAVTGEMRTDPISPQWATKMVTTYPGIGFADVEGIHHGDTQSAPTGAGFGREGGDVGRRIAQTHQRVKVIGGEGHHSPPTLRASTVMGRRVSAAISGRARIQPLARVMVPPHSPAFSWATTGSSRSFLGT